VSINGDAALSGIVHGALFVALVLGYRIVNYWFPLIPGAIAYIRLRLRSGAGSKGKGEGKPPAAQPR
jgi:uncharacterized membrane protein YbhN (UPF0104 family)